ncbi:hypothetical protein ABPG74_015846 [Tetrahymena malaccensis]
MLISHLFLRILFDLEQYYYVIPSVEQLQRNFNYNNQKFKMKVSFISKCKFNSFQIIRRSISNEKENWKGKKLSESEEKIIGFQKLKKNSVGEILIQYSNQEHRVSYDF